VSRRPRHEAAAVVLQASGPNALGIIRSLGREGVPVVACDHDPAALGTTSRYARGASLPDPLTEPDRFVDELLALGRRLRTPGVLFCTHDEALAAIGPREAEVDALFRRPWSGWAAMETAMDKGGQQAAARRIGFPLPATVEPGPGDDPVAAVRDAGLRYPVILKPRYAPEFRRRFRVQVLQADGDEALRRAWDDAAPYGPQVQEVIPGGDGQLWTLGSYRDAEGRPLASFTGRKLRQWPPGFGTARAAEARWDPGLAERCHALLDELGFHGISQVEVKRDPRDGRDHLIEVNPRSWLWVSLATDCGVNLPYACYLDAVGAPRTWAPGHRGGRRWVLSARHIPASIAEIRRGEWGARAFAGSLRPPLRDAVLSLRDPRPALSSYGRLARRAVGR
jgi:predicted ATP-grasp superfamily ATP-dependent carboligase